MKLSTATGSYIAYMQSMDMRAAYALTSGMWLSSPRQAEHVPRLGRQRHQVPRELAELALAHAIKGSAEAAYRRDDALEKRRPMMEAWSRFRVPAKAVKVIPFTAA